MFLSQMKISMNEIRLLLEEIRTCSLVLFCNICVLRSSFEEKAQKHIQNIYSISQHISHELSSIEQSIQYKMAIETKFSSNK